jgi:AcrR family transcriptional regulator
MFPDMKKPKAKKTGRPRNAEATRAKILEAAIEEFSLRGLPDARTEDIAGRCKVNKRMIYYYFGTKEGLYLAALESAYANLAKLEHAIEVEHLDPAAAIAALVNLKIDYYIANPHFISFLNMENLYRARHLKRSKKLAEFKTPLTQVISRILERGESQGMFRRGIDPVDLYISICALGFMYFSNQHTLGVIFERDLMTEGSIKKRRQTIVDQVLSYLQYKGEQDFAPRRIQRAESALVS